jgi:hypothetical protein
MIRVWVDVYGGASRLRAAVWAESIEQALSLTSRRYPDCEARVVFPLDPDTFFVKGPVRPLGTIMSGALVEKAG